MNHTANILQAKSSVFFALCLVLFAYITCLAFLEPSGFWITDNSNKFLLLQNILNSGYTDFSLTWNGKHIDPDYQFNPLPNPFTVVDDGKLYSIFSPVFSTLSTVPFSLFGFPGLYLIPLVASIILLAGLYHITFFLTESRSSANGALLLSAFCTPIWFYSLVFWEHTLAACLCIWAIYFYLKFLQALEIKNLVIANVLAAFSVYFRDDLYLFCAALLASMAFSIPTNRLRFSLITLLTLAITILPLWIFQWLTIDAPFGHHLGTHLFSTTGIADHIADRPDIFYTLFLSITPEKYTSLALAIPLMVSFFLFPCLPDRHFRYAMWAYSTIALIIPAIYLTGLLQAESPIKYLLNASNSFLAVSPIIILGFFHLKATDIHTTQSYYIKWLWLTILLYALLYCMAAPKLGSSGIHWGNRYLLILYPVFSVLAIYNIRHWIKYSTNKQWKIVILIIIISASLFTQIFSVNLLYQKKQFSSQLNQQMEKLTQKVVITDKWWVSSTLYSEYSHKLFFYAKNKKEFTLLISRLAEKGYQDIIFITQNNEASSPDFIEVYDKKLGFFSLKFYTITLNRQ